MAVKIKNGKGVLLRNARRMGFSDDFFLLFWLVVVTGESKQGRASNPGNCKFVDTAKIQMTLRLQSRTDRCEAV